MAWQVKGQYFAWFCFGCFGARLGEHTPSIMVVNCCCLFCFFGWKNGYCQSVTGFKPEKLIRRGDCKASWWNDAETNPTRKQIKLKHFRYGCQNFIANRRDMESYNSWIFFKKKILHAGWWRQMGHDFLFDQDIYLFILRLSVIVDDTRTYMYNIICEYFGYNLSNQLLIWSRGYQLINEEKNGWWRFESNIMRILKFPTSLS